MILGILLFPFVYLVGLAIWLVLFISGIFTVLWAALTKRYISTFGWQGQCYSFTDSFMKLWETHDNGCLPGWYEINYGPGRSRWLNMWIWSAFRNATGGSPYHLRHVPADKLKVYGVDWPSKESWDYFNKTGKRKWCWRLIRYKWRVGIWGSRYIGDGKNYRVIDIQHGFKRQYYKNDPKTGIVYLNFTPWDSGRRTK